MAGGRTGIDGLLDDLAWQREKMTGRCPPYARALELLPSVVGGPAERFLAAAWHRRVFHAPYDRPLLLLAALRLDARADGPAHPLFAAFAAEPPDPDAVTGDRLGAALDGARVRVGTRSRRAASPPTRPRARSRGCGRSRSPARPAARARSRSPTSARARG